jgi:uncharacterized protein with von Willebrand factor type A (vWA) domain
VYKYNPIKTDQTQLKPSHRLNHDLIQKMMGTEQFKELRHFTKMDEVNSALATVTMAKELTELIKTEFAEEAKQANQMCSNEEYLQNLWNQLKEYPELIKSAAGDSKTELEKKYKQAMQDYKKAMKQHQSQCEAQAKNGPGLQNKMRQVVKKATKQALEEAKEIDEIMGAWGTGNNSVQSMTPEERINLALKIKNSTKLKQLSKMLGRFRRLAIHEQKVKVKHGASEIHDTELGSDIGRIIPSEIGLIMNPLTKRLFQKKFAESSLIQYKLLSHETKGKGPIVVCMDSSGSMSGDRELWSKAVALALLDIAIMQKRDFVNIMFGSRGSPMLITEIRKNETAPLPKILQIASEFLCGGTDFEMPLKEARNQIENVGFDKADIVFLTDGECYVSSEFTDDFNRFKQDKDVKVNTILINTSRETSVKPFSDSIVHVENMVLDEAQQIFGRV